MTFKRPCKRCNNLFPAKSKYNYLCKKCTKSPYVRMFRITPKRFRNPTHQSI